MYPEKFWKAGKIGTELGGSCGHSDRGWQSTAEA